MRMSAQSRKAMNVRAPFLDRVSRRRPRCYIWAIIKTCHREKAMPRALIAVALFVLAFMLPNVPPAAAQSGPGWTQLFDGKTLDNWNKIGDSNWRVEDGMIV